jgi:hypothetical protein
MGTCHLNGIKIFYRQPGAVKEKLMKKITAYILFAFSAVCLNAQNLTWELKFLQGIKRESVSISELIKMEAGDDFLVTIKPDEDCYCYMVYDDSEHEIFALKEYLKGGIEKFLDPIPIFEPTGIDTLYVIMSLVRQTKLERLIQTYNINPDSKLNSINLLGEVVNLHTTVSSLGEPPSSFIPGGGTPRGSNVKANHFSDRNLYVKPIKIQH